MCQQQPTLAEILAVLRPHIEKIEDGFKGVRITLDALAEHVSGETVAAVEDPVDPDSSRVEQAIDPPPAIPPTVLPTAVPIEPVPSPPVEEQPPVALRPIPDQPEPIAVSNASDGNNWSQIVFGDHLSVDPSISSLSGTLLADVYAGENDAVGLMGHLMDFRSATAERKPRMLKDIGEAFYRWKPTDDPILRDALIAWVQASLDAVGVANRITVVQVGDRYDMQRHNSKERGVEVSDVSGWVVLRENGKVYSKANVSVR